MILRGALVISSASRKEPLIIILLEGNALRSAAQDMTQTDQDYMD